MLYIQESLLSFVDIKMSMHTKHNPLLIFPMQIHLNLTGKS